MTLPKELFLAQSFKKASKIASMLVTVIGGLALAGWIFDIPFLKCVLPGSVVMKTNAAIGFILGGMGAWALTCREENLLMRFFGRFCSLMVFSIGSLTFLEYIFRVNLGMDQWLFQEAVNAFGTLSPNRMAPTTALNFSLLGISLLLVSKSQFRYFALSQTLTFTAFLTSFLTLMGYIYGVKEFSGIAAYTQMAVHTAIAFIFLSLAIFFSRPDQGIMAMVTAENVGGAVVRRMLPFAVLVPLLIGWLRLQGERLDLYALPFGVAISMVAMAVIFSWLIWMSAVALNKTDSLRRKQEEALRYSETRYKMLYENSKDAIMLLIPQKGFIAGNQSTLDLFGCKDEKEFREQNPSSLSPEYQPDGKLSSDKANEMMAICMERGVHFFEWTHKRIQGEEFEATVLLTRMEIGGEKFLQATVRDISDRKKILRELERKVEELERFNKIAVGRELKMIELKEKVRVLEGGKQ